MARLVKLVSAKSGASATARKVLSTTATTSAPTLSTEGVLLEGARYAWVTVKIGGSSGTTTIKMYAYDPVSLEWALLAPSSEFQFSSTVSGTFRQRVLIEGGPIRIQPVVTSVFGTNPSVDIWIASAVEEP
jgi:hypothetical protein